METKEIDLEVAFGIGLEKHLQSLDIIKETIEVPIYNCKVTVILDKDLKYVQDLYKTKDLSNYGAVTMRVPDRFCEYVIAFEYSEPQIIAHEVVHLVNYIYQDRCIELDLKNDEPQAYLTGWLVEQINNIINN